MSKRIQAACAALLIAGSPALTSCGGHEEHHEETPAFQVTSVLRQDTTITNEFVCQIRAIQHIEVRALESGYLSNIFIDEGQLVHRGQHLFQIMPVAYQAEYAAASAEQARAQIEYQNTQMLREGNVVSPQELALAQAQLDQSTAQRSLAQAHLRFASLDAPFDGIIGRLMVRRGSLLDEGAVLTVLADNSRMWVYFNLSESQYLAYRSIHQVNDAVPVQLKMANGEIFGQQGVIETIEADFNNETGTIAFRAGFPNPDNLLRHGETGEILMTTVLPHVLVIPQESTFRVLDMTYVYVVGDDNVAHARQITTAQELPHLYVVSDGLQEGEHIMINGLRLVHDGDTIVQTVRDPHEVFTELNNLPAH